MTKYPTRKPPEGLYLSYQAHVSKLARKDVLEKVRKKRAKACEKLNTKRVRSV